MRRVIMESPYKRCASCRLVKVRAEFTGDRSRPDGTAAYCKSCSRTKAAQTRATPKHRERSREYQREWAQKPEVRAKHAAYNRSERGREVKRRCRRKAKYGLTHEEFEAMLAQQGGLCGACNGEFAGTRDTHVDHCHRSGEVRAILCGGCNRALGAIDDDERRLIALRDYLQRYRLRGKLEVMGCVGS